MAGDEFAVLLEDIEPEQANAVAQHILSAIRRPFDVSAGQAVVTASVGLLLVDTVASQTTVSAALRDADLALATAKRSGKDRVLTFTAAMRQSRLGHSRMIAGLRRALTSGELSVHYQPIVDLATQRIQAVEALVRWMPPDGPPVPPSEFIPVAEESGLIRDIGEWVLRRACQDARAWYTRSGVAVSVNVSGRQLVDPGFAELVIDALTDAGLPGSALIVELTETSLIATATVATAAAQLDKVRQRGVRVAIDDFGTGYSSLSYLAQLPVDILKIDRSFTRHGERIDFGPDEWPFARAIIALGHGLKLTTVAEGIETVEQARALRELRCQLAQGHLFSWPLPPAGIDALLASDAPLPRGGQLDTSSHVPGMSPGVRHQRQRHQRWRCRRRPRREARWRRWGTPPGRGLVVTEQRRAVPTVSNPSDAIVLVVDDQRTCARRCAGCWSGRASASFWRDAAEAEALCARHDEAIDVLLTDIACRRAAGRPRSGADGRAPWAARRLRVGVAERDRDRARTGAR